MSGTTFNGGEVDFGLPEIQQLWHPRQVRTPVPVQHRRGSAVLELFLVLRVSADTARSWDGQRSL